MNHHTFQSPRDTTNIDFQLVSLGSHDTVATPSLISSLSQPPTFRIGVPSRDSSRISKPASSSLSSCSSSVTQSSHSSISSSSSSSARSSHRRHKSTSRSPTSSPLNALGSFQNTSQTPSMPPQVLNANQVSPETDLPDDYEQRLLAGMELVRSGAISIRAAAKKVQVSHETLRRRCQGASSRQEFHAQLMALTPKEEDLIERMLFTFVTYSNILSSSFLCNLVNNFRKVKATQKNQPPPKDLGISWTAGFRRRHDKVSEIMAKSMNREKPGANSTSGSSSSPSSETPPLPPSSSKSVYDHWFDLVIEAIKKYKIAPESMYNLVEVGFLCDSTNPKSSSLVSVKRAESPKSLDSCTVISTSMECIGANGSSLPPLFSVQTPTAGHNMLSGPSQDYGLLCATSDGWPNDSAMFDWLVKIFDPQTKPKNGEYRLIFVESHAVLFSSQVLLFALKNKILFAVFPHQSSHVLQPFDFGVLTQFRNQVHMLAEKSRIFSSPIPSINWDSYFGILTAARERTFIREAIVAGWEKCGLAPLNKNQALGLLFSNTHIQSVSYSNQVGYHVHNSKRGSNGTSCGGGGEGEAAVVAVASASNRENQSHNHSRKSNERRNKSVVSGHTNPPLTENHSLLVDMDFVVSGSMPQTATAVVAIAQPTSNALGIAATHSQVPVGLSAPLSSPHLQPLSLAEKSTTLRVINATQQCLTEYFGNRPELYYANGRRADVDDAERAGAVLQGLWSRLLNLDTANNNNSSSPHSLPYTDDHLYTTATTYSTTTGAFPVTTSSYSTAYTTSVPTFPLTTTTEAVAGAQGEAAANNNGYSMPSAYLPVNIMERGSISGSVPPESPEGSGAGTTASSSSGYSPGIDPAMLYP
ncbi:uncharacterized protein SAPINGB_P000790 [Magnusiomyces paraingens]|uniref:DDE-1 domain-containing protein n=1 Tax=Magnusiomyces paraingens TaxID=2606893 RepID=A0A5E8B2T7_9ASCO|nr:uncharacterized protein SAPINGB_P000790 [Saprochaete ingens]VVT45558.1 unnamed protein product [Saprochaete ingens]